MTEIKRFDLDTHLTQRPHLDTPQAGRQIARRAIQSSEVAELKNLDWQKALQRFDPNFKYPPYYLKGYHGVSLTESGYLSQLGAATWDSVVRETFSYLEVPGFTQAEVTTMVLEDAARHMGAFRPRSVLDLGTGSGHAALSLAKQYPTAQIWGVDLAAPMLAVAEFKAKQAGLDNRLHFEQANAAELPFPDQTFDLVTAWILFHELPADFTRLVLAEAYRVCAKRGAVLVYDAFGRQVPRFIPFPEPYLKEFQQLDFGQELKKAGFREVRYIELSAGHWYASATNPEYSYNQLSWLFFNN